MIPWETLDRSIIPGQIGELTLRKRGDEFSIRTPDTELMNSRIHGSEDMLAEIAIDRLKSNSGLSLLIGGLGMGYTLAAALKQSPSDTRVTVSELIPAVVDWNKKYLGHLADYPLDNSRVTIRIEDIARTISNSKEKWHAILLDVDNGPEGLTCEKNDRLYHWQGLEKTWKALKPGGILAVWSAGPDPDFTRRLERNKFKTQVVKVRARKAKKGSRHIIWIAQKGI